MNSCFGYYLDVYNEEISDHEVIILFNEANAKPTPEEIGKIEETVKLLLKFSNEVFTSSDDIGDGIKKCVEESELECVRYGIQVFVCGR